MDYGLDGVNIEGNTFKNDDLYDPGTTSLFASYGVAVCDAQVNIVKHTPTNQGNTFYKCNTGVTIFSSSNAPTNTLIKGNNFEQNRCGVMLHGGVKYTVESNTFSGNVGESKSGIILWGAQKTDVLGNDIQASNAGVYLEDVDVADLYKTQVYNNVIHQNNTGVSTFGICNKTQINCNDFQQQNSANWYHDAVIKNQGTCGSSGIPARNLFTDTPPSKDIYVPSTTNSLQSFSYNFQVVGSAGFNDVAPQVEYETGAGAVVDAEPCVVGNPNATIYCDPSGALYNDPSGWQAGLQAAINSNDQVAARYFTYLLINYYIEQGTDLRSAITMLENVPYNFAKFELTGYYLKDKKINEATSLLAGLTPIGSTEKVMKSYLNVLTGLTKQREHELRLTESQLQTIRAMATSGGTREAKYGLSYGAKSLLMWHTNRSYKLRNENYGGGLRITDGESPSDFGIYPNPSPGSFTVSYGGQATELKIYSVTGQLVWSEKIVGERQWTLDQPAGVYLVVLVRPDGSQERKRLFVE